MTASNFLPRAFVDSLMVFERGKFLFCFCADGTKGGVTLFFCALENQTCAHKEVK